MARWPNLALVWFRTCSNICISHTVLYGDVVSGSKAQGWVRYWVRPGN